MENPGKTKSEKLLTELFQETRLLSPQQHPEISMNDLKLLGIQFKHEFKNSTKKVNEKADRKLAMKQIYTKLTEAIELANEFGFAKLAGKLNEVKIKIDKVILK